MSEPGAGRARGRGGRGRRPVQQEVQPGAPAAQAPTPQPMQQPGGAPAAPVGRGRSRGARQVAQAEGLVPQQVQQVAAGPEMASGGRGVQRGGGRERPTNNNNADNLATQMGQLNVAGRQEFRRRAPYERYTDRQFKAEDKPTQGSAGTTVQMLANYFEVSMKADMKIFQYHVDFKPPIENIKVKFALIAQACEKVGSQKLFDGGILYLTKLLPGYPEPYTYYGERNYDNQKVEIQLSMRCEVHRNSPQFQQIANILLKRSQNAIGMKQIRDHFFNTNQCVKVPQHKLDVMPGFITAIAAHDGGSLLVVDVIHKVIRTTTFLDQMYDLYNQMQNKRQEHGFQDECVKTFVGSIVLTKYNNKTYKVDDIDWNKRAKDTFEKHGEQVSYFQYYKDNWGLTITDHDQPLLVSRPTEKDKRRGDTQNLYLVPELCVCTGLTDAMRADFKVMKDLAVHTRVAPPQRIRSLETLSSQLNSNKEVQAMLQPWGMHIGQKVAQFQARELNAEKLIMRNRQGALDQISYEIREADWAKNMRNMRLLNAVHMDNWLMICPGRVSNLAVDLAQCLKRVGSGMGMQIADPEGVEIANDRNESYLQAIRSHLKPHTKIVVTVVTNNKKDRYDAIKKSCCIDNPVPSQVVTQKVLSKQQGLMSVATKIAIQMNCKMGGEVWGAVIPVKGLMVIGLDTYHDSANRNQSVGAMVATLNKECTRYYCKTEYHDAKAEIMQSLSVLVSGALRKYHEVNQANPERIIVYRDGVGDGQLDVVFQSEKEQLEQAFREAGGVDFRPKLGMIIVKKRINTRFFKPGREAMNPMPGTVVDSFVTKKEWYDFFLVSQSVRQGTVSPTSYNVVYDETGLKPDHLQMLTYKMTHLYFNWQGTIRVPAPCQYAHKLAFLQGQSLHREFSAHLSDKLFFL